MGAWQDLRADELKRLPYALSIPTDGRVFPISTFYSASESDWHFYLPHGDPPKLIRMQGGEVISGSYLAEQPASRLDLDIPLGTLVYRHLSFSDVLQHYAKVESVIHRYAAGFEKYRMCWERATDDSTGLLVESELEYLLLLLRSSYDHLQGVVQKVAHRLIALDGTSRRITSTIPSSFADVALSGSELRTAEEMKAKWGMPLPLGAWYVHEAPFFRLIRTLRDGIAHHGRKPPTVFRLEAGFAIDSSRGPWAQFDFGPDDQKYGSQKLISVRGAMAGFVTHAMAAATRLASVLPSFIQMPGPIIVEGVRLFVRSPFGARLDELKIILKQSWEQPEHLQKPD